ncbi:hypothetical protein I6N96_16545 [Enterococcus sp. BWM-S5]|uniref:Uncharacterized protein n=1 Tax=Enterococcus larvae TaxID=2794352 RepID=A0ABS4CPG8_9ENTE|nr:hypothetical protein [Enterococcus larvae]MBP1047902.1 hypothetical protein [Enterococcus larvae]
MIKINFKSTKVMVSMWVYEKEPVKKRRNEPMMKMRENRRLVVVIYD